MKSYFSLAPAKPRFKKPNPEERLQYAAKTEQGGSVHTVDEISKSFFNITGISHTNLRYASLRSRGILPHAVLSNATYALAKFDEKIASIYAQYIIDAQVYVENCWNYQYMISLEPYEKEKEDVIVPTNQQVKTETVSIDPALLHCSFSSGFPDEPDIFKMVRHFVTDVNQNAFNKSIEVKDLTYRLAEDLTAIKIPKIHKPNKINYVHLFKKGMYRTIKYCAIGAVVSEILVYHNVTTKIMRLEQWEAWGVSLATLLVFVYPAIILAKIAQKFLIDKKRIPILYISCLLITSILFFTMASMVGMIGVQEHEINKLNKERAKKNKHQIELMVSETDDDNEHLNNKLLVSQQKIAQLEASTTKRETFLDDISLWALGLLSVCIFLNTTVAKSLMTIISSTIGYKLASDEAFKRFTQNRELYKSLVVQMLQLRHQYGIMVFHIHRVQAIQSYLEMQPTVSQMQKSLQKKTHNGQAISGVHSNNTKHNNNHHVHNN